MPMQFSWRNLSDNYAHPRVGKSLTEVRHRQTCFSHKQNSSSFESDRLQHVTNFTQQTNLITRDIKKLQEILQALLSRYQVQKQV